MNVLMYCQHSVGLGHLMRTLRIAEGLSTRAQVTVIVGGVLPNSVGRPVGVELLALPPLSMVEGGTLIDPFKQNDPDLIKRRRLRKLIEIAETVKPDVLIVEMYPFGRKKFRDEISTLLHRCRRQYGTKILSSVRDILVTKRRDQARFNRRALKTLNEDFDALMIHADPAVAEFAETFPLFDEIAIPFCYTGYVCDERARLTFSRERRVIISVGGGAVGERLFEVAREAASLVKSSLDLDMLILRGALADANEAALNEIPGLSIQGFATDFPELLAQSCVSVSQCGYNTAADILHSGTAAVFVPFETDTEDEQVRRALKIERFGVGICVREGNLTAVSLVDAIAHAAATKRARRSAEKIDLDGVDKTVRFVAGTKSYAFA